MSRELERKVAKKCGVSHQIFTTGQCTTRKEVYDEKVINKIGMIMRKELLEKGWKSATERQVLKALVTLQIEPEFRCTAVTCGCIGQKVVVSMYHNTVKHSGNNANLFHLYDMRYEYGVGRALLMSPRTRKQLGI